MLYLKAESIKRAGEGLEYRTETSVRFGTRGDLLVTSVRVRSCRRLDDMSRC
jgi:hypothetical protein